MTAVAITVVLTILVGFPLLAWWLGGRRRWARLDALGRDQADADRRWRSDHRLSAIEVTEVDSALTWGRALTDERLRAAVVRRAGMLQAAERAWEQSHPRLTATMRWLTLVWLLLLVTAFVFSVSRGDWPVGLSLYLLAAAAGYGVGWLRRRNWRRAIELNGG